MQRRYALEFQEIEEIHVALVGGKGAQLAALSRIEGIAVPAGVCVTTDAFRRFLAQAPSFDDQLDRLARLRAEDREAIRELGDEITTALDATAIPEDVAFAISRSVAGLGEHGAFAVRSSATAEDLPTVSFAGQHESYLNVGATSVLRHIRRCWASLFTERAITYRLRHGVEHPTVAIAVVVQRMAFAQAAGVLFTADPLSSNRKVVHIEAGFGLGEGLVGGLVNPDVYKVAEGAIIARTIADKRITTCAAPAGGTETLVLEPERRRVPVLTDAQSVALAQLGRRIEAGLGHPVDVEWCLVEDGFQIVQARPITTLFPIPEAGDGETHVYVSVGHQQMMTDPLRPLGLSVWHLTTSRFMAEAGGRLFVDVAAELASPASRARILALGRSDPLIGDALQTIIERGDVISMRSEEPPGEPQPGDAPDSIETDPAIVAELIERSEASLDTLKRDIRTRSGPALLDFILADIQELRRILFDPRGLRVIMAAMEATWWLNEQLQAWLGEKNAADALTQAVPHNVTSEMGLALLDVADAIRPHPTVVAFLETVRDDGFLEELPTLAGGREARDAIRAYLDTYGMRCAGEIDITAPRWSERPSTLLPALLGNIRNFEPGEGGRRLERGRREASSRERELLARLAVLPDGERKADQTRRMIERVRTFTGYREYPKYGMVSRYFVYKRALLDEADRLARDGVLRNREDIFFLRFEELRDIVRTGRVDDELIARRRAAFRSYRALTPPRVFTSDGEVLTGTYRHDDVPTGAFVGLPVSAGGVEGRARVILDMAAADLEPGDILVTAYTDPSWTPLFLAITGLVTEVGGLMTHGAVIAREYGLPAVVGVEDATRLIRDGQRIRVHGTDGYVEILA